MENHFVEIDYVEDDAEFEPLREYCNVTGLEMLILEEHGVNGWPVVRLTGQPDTLRRALVTLGYELDAQEICQVRRI